MNNLLIDDSIELAPEVKKSLLDEATEDGYTQDILDKKVSRALAKQQEKNSRTNSLISTFKDIKGVRDPVKLLQENRNYFVSHGVDINTADPASLKALWLLKSQSSNQNTVSTSDRAFDVPNDVAKSNYMSSMENQFETQERLSTLTKGIMNEKSKFKDRNMNYFQLLQMADQILQDKK
ncbi:MAG: hypothetical protein OEZ01_00165 [Candidatus Heimdallarchaeota archaeon]|nr:hypothetical protein [Candidatus Heimdallarchaeota archaeon]